MKKILFSLMCCFVAMTASAQSVSWNSVLDDVGVSILKMKLEKYGKYQNGNEVTTAYPSQSAGNSQEGLIVSLNQSRGSYCLEMNKTKDGWTEFSGSYSGNMLRHKEIKHRGESGFSACTGFWRLLSFKKLNGDKFRIVTVDDNNIYRYYIGDMPSVEEQFINLLLN